MRNAIFIFILLSIFSEMHCKGEKCQTNSIPEFMCDDYGRLSTTVDNIKEGVFLINAGRDIREMYYCGHCCDYIVTDSSLIYHHSAIYWEDEWELDSELKTDTIIEVSKYAIFRNILQEICNNQNIQLDDIIINERYIEFQPYSEIIVRQLTGTEEFGKELLCEYQSKNDYRLSKLSVNDNTQIPFYLQTNYEIPKYLLEFTDVISNMVFVRLRELSTNNSCSFLILLKTDGSIKKIYSEENVIVNKYDHKDLNFHINQDKQEFDRYIIGNKKVGYCIYDKSGDVLFKLNNIQNTKDNAATIWCHIADYCSIRENENILSYRNGILHYNELAQINDGNLENVTISKRYKSDIIMEMKNKLAKYLNVNSDNLSLCDTVIQFKPEYIVKKIPASKRLEKEILSSYYIRNQNSQCHNITLLHSEFYEIEKNTDTKSYIIYYSEFIDNMLYVELKSKNIRTTLKVLFILDNRGNIEEFITS